MDLYCRAQAKAPRWRRLRDGVTIGDQSLHEARRGALMHVKFRGHLLDRQSPGTTDDIRFDLDQEIQDLQSALKRSNASHVRRYSTQQTSRQRCAMRDILGFGAWFAIASACGSKTARLADPRPRRFGRRDRDSVAR